MATRARIQGLKEKRNDFREIIFDKDCNNLKDILEAVEQAFDRDADIIILRRIRPVKKFS